ncbi:flagellar basal body rod protein FlgC [Maritalea mobilis]|uniref:Flagellar basal body rod protein FlgB n=1 Tax=[Roseibacterium] beibuensis TaxID=1193142 RepID=A0ABP9LB62_9RHOB|nr:MULTISPECIES: flagellar basal body rod protein FlgC [Alphaproteobacteria]MBY6201802.1 flagellar basal body rod protein FlgC [Maritalea mobilis]MCS6626538.1 flagellar basal body rod protein FlgC [Roseibacterium beibuensis]
MTDFSSALSVAASGMRAQAQRLQHVSENIANADTPGYRRKLVSFAPDRSAEAAQGAVQPGPVRLSRADLPQIYDPGHPLADDTGHYDGSNVDLVVELADAREAQRSYEANLRVFDQVRQMSSSLNELLRR